MRNKIQALKLFWVKYKKKILIIILAVIVFTALVLIISAKRSKNKELAVITPSPTPFIFEMPNASPPTFSSEWKKWSDPNEFNLMYPPRAKAGFVNDKTTISEKTADGTYSLYFCKTCQVIKCEGTCNKKADIEIQFKKEKIKAKSICPNNKGNCIFTTKVPYPHLYKEEYLYIFAEYENEKNIEIINQILGSFKFAKDYKYSSEEAVRIVKTLKEVQELASLYKTAIKIEQVSEDEARNAWVIVVYKVEINEDEQETRTFVNQYYVEKYTGEVTPQVLQ